MNENLLVFLLNLVQLEMQAPSLIIILVLFAFQKDVWCRQHSRFRKSSNEDKIVGGYEDTVRNTPYIVSIIFENAGNLRYRCAGSIISENYVLTSAHCAQGMIKATIRAGSSEVYSGGQQYTSAQIILHPSYDPETVNNDVAVIRTTRPIKLDGINTKAVKLAEQECDIKSGTNIKVSGWGATEENGYSSRNLMSVVVQAVSRDVCSHQLSLNITTSQFCAGVSGGSKDSCPGDSGGPAVVSASPQSEYTRTTCSPQIGEQVGIVSFSYACARKGLPGVYTRVSCVDVRSWIKRTTGV